jgi:hypothetical protein
MINWFKQKTVVCVEKIFFIRQDAVAFNQNFFTIKLYALSLLKSVDRDQGCQMAYFQTKNLNLGKF